MPARAPRRLNARASGRSRRGQSAFEYLLLITGAALFVILAVAVVRTAINTNSNSTNNTAGGYQQFISDKSETSLYQSVVGDACAAGWSMSEGSGTTTTDASGNGNTGTLTTAAMWTTGMNGNGLAIDGYAGASNYYVDVGTNASVNSISSEITVAGWIKQTVADSYGYLVSNDRNCCGAYKGYSLAVYSLTPIFQVWDSDSTSHTVSATSTIPLATWHFIAGTFNGSASKIYVDGVLNNTSYWTGTIGTPANFTLRVGAMGYNPTYRLNGTVDEAAIYNRALTPDEIRALYRAKTAWCS